MNITVSSMKLSLAVLGLATLAACNHSVNEDDATSPGPTSDTSVTIMTFNVENLFDSTHDEGKDDYTYLPRVVKDDPAHIARCETLEVERWRRDCLELDWNEEAVVFKLSQLAKTILEVNDGLGPDVIAFQEVENAAILTRLSQEYLQAAGYGDAFWWADPTVPSRRPTARNVGATYPDVGVNVWRSGWQDDATILLHHCGRKGQHKIIPVPVGTRVSDADTEELIGEVLEHGQRLPGLEVLSRHVRTANIENSDERQDGSNMKHGQRRPETIVSTEFVTSTERDA